MMEAEEQQGLIQWINPRLRAQTGFDKDGFIPVDVQLSVVGQVVVDDERDLWHIQSSGPHVCRDQHSATATHKHQNFTKAGNPKGTVGHFHFN